MSQLYGKSVSAAPPLWPAGPSLLLGVASLAEWLYLGLCQVLWGSVWYSGRGFVCGLSAMWDLDKELKCYYNMFLAFVGMCVQRP